VTGPNWTFATCLNPSKWFRKQCGVSQDLRDPEVWKGLSCRVSFLVPVRRESNHLPPKQETGVTLLALL
jgi:hypothetical protein